MNTAISVTNSDTWREQGEEIMNTQFLAYGFDEFDQDHLHEDREALRAQIKHYMEDGFENCKQGARVRLTDITEWLLEEEQDKIYMAAYFFTLADNPEYENLIHKGNESVDEEFGEMCDSYMISIQEGQGYWGSYGFDFTYSVMRVSEIEGTALDMSTIFEYGTVERMCTKTDKFDKITETVKPLIVSDSQSVMFPELMMGDGVSRFGSDNNLFYRFAFNEESTEKLKLLGG